MRKYRFNLKILVFYAFVLVFLFLLFNFPASSEAALVPCGTSTNPDPCNFCDFLRLGKNIIDFLMYIIFPIATVMIIWGGIIIMTSRESPEQVKRGRGVITAAVVGLLIALLSWIILDTIFKVISPRFEAASLGPWNQLKCELK